MNARKLTDDQIDFLFDFCRKHYVEYYDLQAELVDHLASEVEVIWEYQPEMSFQQALDKSFGKFGIYGFSKIKAAKQKEMKKRYSNLTWGYFKSYYQLPKIILTAGIAFFIYELFRLIPYHSVLIYTYVGGLFVFLMVCHYYFPQKYYKITVDESKKFLLIETLNNLQISFGMIPIVLFQIPNLLHKLGVHSFPWWGQVLLSAFISGFSILTYAYYFVIPNLDKPEPKLQSRVAVADFNILPKNARILLIRY